LHASILADDHQAANPRQVERQAGAQDVATATDAPGRGADIGRRLQDRFHRRDHFALGVGGVLRQGREFRRGVRNLLGAGVLERAGAFQHQRRHQDQRQQCEPRADSEKLLEFDSFAVETNA
jgi:hypothetical protein